MTASMRCVVINHLVLAVAKRGLWGYFIIHIFLAGQNRASVILSAMLTRLLIPRLGACVLSVLLLWPLSTSAFFDRPLFRGTSGEDVSLLQTVLRNGGFYVYPEITGIFGFVTEQALQAFQRHHNIVSSGTPETTGYGRLGPVTRTFLNNILALDQTGPSLTASLLSSAIYRIQELLIQTGYTSIIPNGVLDAATQAAISHYQQGSAAVSATTTATTPGRGSGGGGGGGGGGSPAPDTTPPARSGGQPAGTLPSGTTEAALELTTNEAATCKYDDTPGVAFADMSGTFSTTGNTTHQHDLTGLTDGTSYTFYVRCSDAADNANPDDFAISFSVADDAPDEMPPVISAVASSTSVTSATVTWTTDEPATSHVAYGTSAGVYTGASSSASLVTSHSLVLTGLSADTLYYFVVVSSDASDNAATSSEYTFATAEAPDTTAPAVAVTGPANGAVASTSIALAATASDDDSGVAGVQFKYLPGTNIGTENTSEPYQVTWNTALMDDGEYQVVAVARDNAGNYATSSAVTIHIDNTAPIITLLGDDPQTIEAGDPYTELGATANDARDGDLTDDITIDASEVDTDTPATYEVTYSVEDEAGNLATTSRTVIVADTSSPAVTDPVITVTDVSTSTLTLSWTAATDTVTPQALLEYRIYHSLEDNISTPEDAVENGSLIHDWEPDLTTAEVTSVEPDTLNYFNVIVRDQADNLAAYATTGTTTAAESGPEDPEPPLDGLVLTLDYDPTRDGLPFDHGWQSHLHHFADPKGASLDGNGEFQFFMRHDYDWSVDFTPFEIADGALRIRAVKTDGLDFEEGEIPDRPGDDAPYPYVSGVLASQFRQQGGYFEMRAKMTSGNASYPHFFLMGESELTPPEIDIFEYIGNEPDKMWMNSNTLEGGWGANYHHDAGVDLSADYHVYAVEWTATELKRYVDGVLVHTRDLTNAPSMQVPMHMITGQSIGTNLDGWVPPPDETTPDPADLHIDYIRVWQRPGPYAIEVSNVMVPADAESGDTLATLEAEIFGEPSALTWEILSDPDNKFQIDGAALKADGTFDFEDSPRHKVMIKVTDSNGASWQKLITMIVEPAVADNDLGAAADAMHSDWNEVEVTKTDHADPDFATVLETAANEMHYLQNFTFTKEEERADYRFTSTVEGIGRRYVRLLLTSSEGSSGFLVWYDLQEAKVTSYYRWGSGGFEMTEPFIAPAGGRLTVGVDFKSDAAGDIYWQIGPTLAPNDTWGANYPGETDKGLIIGNMQLVSLSTGAIFEGSTAGSAVGVVGAGGSLPGWELNPVNGTPTVTIEQATHIVDNIEAIEVTIDAADNGDYTEVQFFLPTGWATAPAATGETWRLAAYLQVLEETGGGLSWASLQIHEADAGFGYLGSSDPTDLTPTIRLPGFADTYGENLHTMGHASTTLTVGAIGFGLETNGQAASVRFRISALLEKI